MDKGLLSGAVFSADNTPDDIQDSNVEVIQCSEDLRRQVQRIYIVDCEWVI